MEQSDSLSSCRTGKVFIWGGCLWGGCLWSGCLSHQKLSVRSFCVCVWVYSVMSDFLQHHELYSSSLHRILQARVLDRVAMPSSRGSCTPRDQTHVSWIIGSRFFTTSVIRRLQYNKKKLIVRCLRYRVPVIGEAYATGMHPVHSDTGKTRFRFDLGH